MTDQIINEAPRPATEPTAIDTRPLTDVCFENFALHPLLLKGLEETGLVRCTPIQALTLPLALVGRDLAGQAQTGTGKTAAFLVAVFNRLLQNPARAERKDGDPRAVILAPTRELAIQIEKDARQIGRHAGLKLALIYGGVDYDKQREALKQGVDVVIATPGRIIDYLKQNVVSFRAVEITVLDEADRMFDLGFIKDIRFLFRRMPVREERQSLLFSATLSHRVLELAYEHMNNAEKVTAETDTVTADRVRQVVYFPANEEKIPLLLGLLARMDARRTMVFINTKVWAERVAIALERAHFRVGLLSGDVPQKKREKLLGRFQKGELEILVATDVAARGLHIPDVSHVFNFDLPFDAEDYVHRIGRTARLGAEGDAISFACELYAPSLPDIEAYIEMKLPVASMDPTLLLHVPRTPRPAQAGDSDEEGDMSGVAAAREERQARRAKERERGGSSSGGRSGSGSGSGGGRSSSSSGPRRDGGKPPSRGAGSGSGGASRGPRRAPDAPAAVAGVEEKPVATIAGDAPAKLEGERRRRRRGGRGRNRTEGAENAATPATPAKKDAVAQPPTLLTRIKQGLKNLVNRLPMPGRRR
jgi:ATP-dependent RNA helicase RhlB